MWRETGDRKARMHWSKDSAPPEPTPGIRGDKSCASTEAPCRSRCALQSFVETIPHRLPGVGRQSCRGSLEARVRTCINQFTETKYCRTRLSRIAWSGSAYGRSTRQKKTCSALDSQAWLPGMAEEDFNWVM